MNPAKDTHLHIRLFCAAELELCTADYIAVGAPHVRLAETNERSVEIKWVSHQPDTSRQFHGHHNINRPYIAYILTFHSPLLLECGID